MKKLIIIIFALFCFQANSQIVFSNIEIVDNFGDVIEEREAKTKITANNNKLIVTEKNKKEKIYDIGSSLNNGSEENLIYFSGGIYGFETIINLMRNGTPYTGVYRVASRSKDKFEFETSVFWIENAKTEKRIIYFNK